MTLKNVAVVLTKRGMGQAPSDLMEVLLEKYLKILSEEPDVPRYLLMYSAGVEVARAGSKYLDWLRILEQKGCQVLLCGTCLEYYGLKGQHPVGLNSCMNDIVKAMEVVDKVITL
jgi:sulfur relay (sulfurtransferase) complex TusBCD TusD component (DsrE family)